MPVSRKPGLLAEDGVVFDAAIAEVGGRFRVRHGATDLIRERSEEPFYEWCDTRKQAKAMVERLASSRGFTVRQLPTDA